MPNIPSCAGLSDAIDRLPKIERPNGGKRSKGGLQLLTNLCASCVIYEPGNSQFVVVPRAAEESGNISTARILPRDSVTNIGSDLNLHLPFSLRD